MVEDPPRGEDPVPEMEVEVESSLVLDSSSPSPPPTAPAPIDTAQQSLEHIHVSSRELAAVMDVVCALATTQVSLDQRVARVQVTLAQSHTMLLWIMNHLGLLPKPTQTTRGQSTAAASLDMLAAVAAAAAASDPPASPPPRE